ncbi:C45 family autoproteolytic acyltransferase/hydolase [Streptomyces sparsogenes]|uniref:Peptidase C45 acyl-coenzyme A:6-aminopenicillanic acid acyl-transferase n=1 Tax=Streptomyces sparsogenes DSM 40356 TaxID=1331668 RepID=A0A1R1SFR8_9ACTN|nr:C45 family peptidase [Streptomyces sparsogenes]OMI37072.1 peptidase C45 acyl-coenzyme A:6-aminopenicillanic acid acyl-transferase [Streptomyces sparsogenes DSM 40356]
MNPVPPLIAVEGDYRSMGEQIGVRTADMIARSVETYSERFRSQARLDDETIDRWGLTYYDLAQQYDPDIAAMLDGMAAGSGQPLSRIVALNARTELLYGTGYRDEGCTSLAVLPSHTDNGHTLLAQNWDWHPEQAEVTFLLATRDPSGFTVLSLTEAGMLAKSGLNSAGLGVCANLLVSDRDAGGEGVPYHFLLRGALQSTTMAKAHQRLLPVRRISSGNVLIADASGGEAIDFELAPDVFGTLLPDSGLLAHANHFLADLPLTDLKAATSALTQLRPTRVRHLLAPAIAQHNVSTTDVVRVLRDEWSYPDGICRYPDPQAPTADQVSTVYSIVMDLTARTLWIAPGPPSKHPYTRWELDAPFGSPAAAAAHDFAPED